jgi:nucleotide-binding universal stress UspA family protein
MTIKLLVPFDGSPAALHAVELIAGYAGDVSVLAPVALNVQMRPLSLWPGPALAPGVIEAALLDEGRSTLEPAVLRLAAAGMRAAAEVRLGVPAESILREAAVQKAEVVVMGTRGAGILQGFALGSVALRVAHGKGSPVLLVKPRDRLPAALGKRLRVLLAMDGSEPAVRAAERLAGWRSWLGELDVQLVYVQRPLTALQALLPPHDDLIEQWSMTEAEHAAQKARDLFSRDGIAHHLHVTVGDSALELCALVEQTSSDLVALGTRGLGAAHHAIVGSVALKVAASSPVPVLLVP